MLRYARLYADAAIIMLLLMLIFALSLRHAARRHTAAAAC